MSRSRLGTVISLLLGCMGRSTAWRPLQDHSRIPLNLLKAEGDDHHGEIEAIRSQLEDTFWNTYVDNDDSLFFEYDAIFRLRDDSIQSMVPPLESVEEPSVNKDDWVDTTACGEDCEECEIPPDFKSLVDPGLDVMAFLGIQRAEPIRIDRHLDDWE